MPASRQSNHGLSLVEQCDYDSFVNTQFRQEVQNIKHTIPKNRLGRKQAAHNVKQTQSQSLSLADPLCGS